jgi:hypothetical protein
MRGARFERSENREGPNGEAVRQRIFRWMSSEGPKVPRTIRAAQPREEADHPAEGFLLLAYVMQLPTP